jgi:uncharacterized protein
LSDTLLIRETKNGLSFDIHVNPHASRAGIAGLAEGMLKVRVTAPPVEGAANEACLALVAKKLGLRKSQMSIAAGARSRRKTLQVSGISKAELERKIEQLDMDHP